MNKIKAQKLISTAKRTIKIVELLMEGKNSLQVLEELDGFKPRVERQLINYYERQLK